MDVAKRLFGAFFVGGCLGLACQLFASLWRMALGADSAYAVPAALVSLGVAGGVLYVAGLYQKIEKVGFFGAALPFSGLVSAVAGQYLDGRERRRAAPRGGQGSRHLSVRAGLGVVGGCGCGRRVLPFAVRR